MNIHFTKYHGTGNDFVVVDNRSLSFRPTSEQVKLICHRRFGVGADGLILLETDESGNTLFFMNYFNSDGSQSFCGNGSRCAVHFARSLGLFEIEGYFTAIDGRHFARIVAAQIEIQMGETSLPKRIEEGYFIDTGSPHVMIYTDDVANVDVKDKGADIRYSNPWKVQGTNVNFLSRVDSEVHMRTYERGVEDETLSCGTGATAAAITDAFLHGGDERTLHTKGGTLIVRFTRLGDRFTDVWLCGPASPVFTGNLTVV